MAVLRTLSVRKWLYEQGLGWGTHSVFPEALSQQQMELGQAEWQWNGFVAVVLGGILEDHG